MAHLFLTTIPLILGVWLLIAVIGGCICAFFLASLEDRFNEQYQELTEVFHVKHSDEQPENNEGTLSHD